MGLDREILAAQATIYLHCNNAIDQIISVNEDLHRRFGKGISYDKIIELYTALEAMELTKGFSITIAEAIFSVRELLHVCVDYVDHPPPNPYGKEREEDASWKWKARASQHPGHRSRTNSEGEEGWKTGRFVDYGPSLLRGTNRPSRTGGA